MLGEQEEAMNTMTVPPIKWFQRVAAGVTLLGALAAPACGTAP